MNAKRHSAVIVGGGFAAIRAAKLLAQDSVFEVTLISENTNLNYHPQIFRPSSNKSPLHIDVPLQDIFRHRKLDVDLVRARIEGFSPKQGRVKSDKGTEYRYDSLIIATGRTGIKNKEIAGRHVYDAYNKLDVEKARRSLITHFENAEVPANVVVIGAGLSGVELAGEISELAAQLRKKHKYIANHPVVNIVDEQSQVLPNEEWPNAIRGTVKKRLKQLGVVLHMGVVVRKFGSGSVFLSNGKVLSSAFVINAGGQMSSNLITKNKAKFQLSQAGFVRVNDLLEVEGYNNVYAIGDCAESEYAGYIEQALYDANFVVSTLHNKIFGTKLERYEPEKPALTLPIGKNWVLIHENGETTTGNKGWKKRRWIDRKHFSTLLSKRLLYKHWLRGERPDEIS